MNDTTLSTINKIVLAFGAGSGTDLIGCKAASAFGEGQAAACIVALAGIREGIQVLLFLAIAAGESPRQGTHHRTNNIGSEGSITETEFFRNKDIGESLDSA